MSTTLFDCSKLQNVRFADGTPITSFKMRETDGKDEEVAANMSHARGGSPRSLEELLRLSLVEVNGEPVNQGKPYLEYDRWSSRARSFALTAFRSLNMSEDKEDTDFLAAAAACD